MRDKWLQVLVVASLWVLIASPADAANVLAVFPLFSRSHWFASKPLITGLSERGHNITLITCDLEKDLPDNWEVMRVPIIVPRILTNKNLFREEITRSWKLYDVMMDYGLDICEKLFRMDPIQNLINAKDRKFDLLLMEYFMYDCFVAFSHKFRIPIVATSPVGGLVWATDVFGDPQTPSYVPDLVNDYTDHMTFWQRLHNAMTVTYARYLYSYCYLPKADEIVWKYFKDPTMPSISALMANASLVIVNSHISFSYPRPHVPNVIEAGGMHIHQPHELPQDLKKLLDGSKHGVIFFSMGSIVRSADFSQERVQAFISVFSKLKQLVIWKWENDTIPGKPSNVHLGKWFPQSDLLAHKNIRLFVSHGGLQSSVEATARGVPVVGIPVAAEQRYNIQRIVSAGCGVRLDLNNITAQSVQWAVSEVLHNPAYRENAKHRSELFWDRPQSAVDTAVYWTEYVLRHKGAPHLRSASVDLTWYQYLLLDVIGLLILGATVVLLIIVAAVRKIASLITEQTSSSHKQKKTTKRE